MTQSNSQPQPNRQYLIGDIQISGSNNNPNIIQGDNNHFFKYEITPHGGVVNILPPEQAPRITAHQTPVRLRPRAFSELLGRETEIEQSVTALKALQMIELYGSAGIGKSVLLRQLAYHEIAESLKHFPDGVIYFYQIRGELVEDLQQELFKAFYDSDRPFKPSAVRVRHYLQNKRALILLDNANLSRKDIGKLGEIAPNCVFAFTSSERSLWGEGQPIQVGGLSPDAALDLIERELKRSLTAQEQAAAKAICSSLNGHPLEILQQIAGARESREWLADVAGRVQKNTSQKARIEQSLKPLSQQKRSILAALAALGGIAISAQQAFAIADVRGAESELGILKEMHLVQQEGSRYSLSTNLLDSVKEIENLTPYMERAVSFVTKWAQNTTPGKLQQESEAISYLLQWSVKQGRWNDVLMLGKPFESALALSGQWELQTQVLQWYEQAAENLGDESAVAWALHQSGVRSLGLGEMSRARNLLNKAFKLRQDLGDVRGAELTQRCLKFKFPITDFLVPTPPQPTHQTDLLSKALVPALVGVMVLSLLSYELLKTHQETANLRRENQELRRETNSLNEKTSTSSKREKELTLILDKTTKERDVFRQQRDDANSKLGKSDAAAKKTKEELEALKNRSSLLGLNLSMVPLSVNVEECRSVSLKLLKALKAEEFWGQSAEIKDSGERGAAAFTSTKDGGIFIACSSFGDRSIASISAASVTPEAKKTVDDIQGNFTAFLNDPSLLRKAL